MAIAHGCPKEEPVSEDWYDAAVECAATGEILPNGKEMIDFDKVKVFRAGVQWKEQQMMKDAVPGRILVNRFGNIVAASWSGIQQLELLHTYDKIKLIIIKED